MTVYLFAGPNGSGKSTIIAEYISFYGLDEIEYICPDIYASELFNDIDNVCERYKKAMEFAKYKRKRLLKESKSMIIETVLSRTDKIDFVKEAKLHGYRIISVFVGTESVDINCSRVKQRVLQGGHGVPEEKIRKRYYKSMENLTLLAECSDELYVYDNSTDHPVLGLSLIDDDVFITAECADWIKNIK